MPSSGGNDTFNQLVKNAIAEKQIREDSSRYAMGPNQRYQLEESKEKKAFNVYDDIDQIEKIIPK